MSAVDALVLLLLLGLVLRFAVPPMGNRKATPVELPPEWASPPLAAQEVTHPFDRDRMVQMLREQGHIDEARARELLRDA